MGRVASKRKLKVCDPFFKGKRDNGKKAKAYDLPPNETKSAKKRKRKQLNEAAIEDYVLRVSTVDDKDNKNKKNVKLDNIGTIRPNETMKEFNKRINTEVKRVIADESKKTLRKSVKRKEYVVYLFR